MTKSIEISLAVALTAAISLGLILAGKSFSAVALTLTVAVGIINGLWLERLLLIAIQPGKPRFSGRAIWLLVARLVLWGLLFVLLYLMRKHIDLWVVAVGVVIVLAALTISVARGEENHPPED